MTHYTRPIVASLLALSTLAGSAHAETVSAFYGKAYYPSEAGCFSESYGTLTNICSGGAKLLKFSLIQTNATGYYSGIVNAYGPNGLDDVSCYMVTANSDTSVGYIGPTGTLSAIGYPVDIPLGSIVVFNRGTLNLDCWVKPGGRVQNITWTRQ